MNVKKLVLNSLLTTISLIIFVLESFIPPLTPIPGIKIGLANIITLFAIYNISCKDAFTILILRVILSSIFSGQFMSFIYSISGGILCLIFMSISKRFFDSSQMWITSVIGAVFHNLGQIIIAVIVTGTIEIIWYFPFLIVGGLIAGLFTGLTGQYLTKMIKDLNFV